MPSVKPWVGALALAGCVSYRGGTLAREAAPGTAVVEVGCLDVAAGIADDAVAAWPVVALELGNRCDRPVPVDLRAIDAFGHTRRGAIVGLVPYDPRAEMTAVALEARSRGKELVQYRDGRDLAVVGDDLVDVCLDLAAVGAAPASATPVVRCFPRAPSPSPSVAQAEVAP